MNYRIFKACDTLTDYVDCFWSLEGGPDELSEEKIFPDGSSEIVFNLDEPFRQIIEGVTPIIQPLVLWAGTSTKPVSIAPTGRIRLFGIRFLPGGASAFWKFPMIETADRILNARDVIGENAAILHELLYASANDTIRCRHAEGFLMKTLRTHNRAVREAVHRILKSSGEMSVEDVAYQAALSPRQLERTFLHHVGLTPKMLIRIVRFQRVLNALREQKDTSGLISAACGYYDQSHLIRDFRQFTGEIPTGYRDQERAFTEFFIRREKMSDFYNLYD